jgi:hypothetical protein
MDIFLYFFAVVNFLEVGEHNYLHSMESITVCRHRNNDCYKNKYRILNISEAKETNGIGTFVKWVKLENENLDY